MKGFFFSFFFQLITSWIIFSNFCALNDYHFPVKLCMIHQKRGKAIQGIQIHRKPQKIFITKKEAHKNHDSKPKKKNHNQIFYFFLRAWTYHLRIQSKTIKIPKNSKIHNKSTKPIQIWTDWYPKNNPNSSKFRNPKFGEITNHKTTLEVVCGGTSSRNGVQRHMWRGGAPVRRGEDGFRV